MPSACAAAIVDNALASSSFLYRSPRGAPPWPSTVTFIPLELPSGRVALCASVVALMAAGADFGRRRRERMSRAAMAVAASATCVGVIIGVRPTQRPVARARCIERAPVSSKPSPTHISAHTVLPKAVLCLRAQIKLPIYKSRSHDSEDGPLPTRRPTKEKTVPCSHSREVRADRPGSTAMDLSSLRSCVCSDVSAERERWGQRGERPDVG